MPDAFDAARGLVARIRFAGDVPAPEVPFLTEEKAGLTALFYRDGMEITSALMPRLREALDQACTRLAIPPGTVVAFVYEDPHVAASCHWASEDRIHVRFSSGLVGLFDVEEFSFVAGHEIGHYLLRHFTARSIPGTPGHYAQMRAMEISVDRIGMLACDSLQVALRAVMKSVSGLSSRNMRFDVGAFIDQVRRVGKDQDIAAKGDRHPPMLIRARALLWFSTSETHRRWPNPVPREGIAKVDAQIQRDLDLYVHGADRRGIEALRKDLALWSLTRRIIGSGSFTKAVQAGMTRHFGEEIVGKLKGFLSEMSIEDLNAHVDARVASTLEALNAYGDLVGSEAVDIDAIASDVLGSA